MRTLLGILVVLVAGIGWSKSTGTEADGTAIVVRLESGERIGIDGKPGATRDEQHLYTFVDVETPVLSDLVYFCRVEQQPKTLPIRVDRSGIEIAVVIQLNADVRPADKVCRLWRVVEGDKPNVDMGDPKLAEDASGKAYASWSDLERGLYQLSIK